MRQKTAHPDEAYRLLLRLAVLGFLALAAALPPAALLLRAGPSLAQERDAGNEPGNAEESLYLRLTGPNDGEPINSRILRLKLETNYPGRGTLRVEANDVLLYTRSLHDGARRDPESGSVAADVDLDLQTTQALLGEDLFHPDAGPLQVKVSLLGEVPARPPVLSGRWSGYIGKPWFDLIHTNIADLGKLLIGQAGGVVNAQPQALPRAVVHPMEKDMYFLLLAGPGREVLSLSPDDPELFSEARIVASGTCYPAGPEARVRTVVNLDSLLLTPWRQGYLVLWTYDIRGGWKRSVITPLFSR